jgi:exodeoxyribonuclease V alpha subunit
MSDALLQQALAAGALHSIDLHLARWLARTAGGGDADQLLAAALASQRTGAGDVCLDLNDFAARRPFEALPDLCAPPLADWREALLRWPIVGRPDQRAPLILDQADRLYLGRYFAYEQGVARSLRHRAAQWSRDVDLGLLGEGLTRLFGPLPAAASEPDWQRVAAAIAVLKPLCVISGGPGTGKTHTVAAILALLGQQALRQGRTLRVALAAPTGKAAARLTESIRNARAGLDPQLARLVVEPSSGTVQDAGTAQTLHRLLGFRPGRVRPRRHRDNPLHLDLLVVDEASMLDLPVMARLLDALPDTARLILLGDRDQLASVESGMILGDLCGQGRIPAYSQRMRRLLADYAGLPMAQPALQGDLFADEPADTPLGDCIALLRKSWRFRRDSGIGALAAAVNAGDVRGALAVADAGQDGVRRLELDADGLRRFLTDEFVPRYRGCLAAGAPQQVLRALGGFRLLCAVRSGPFGVEGVNALAESVLEQAGVIRRDGRAPYPGRPVMVTANDYGIGLYNGDIGIVLPDANGSSAPLSAAAGQGDALRVWFETEAGPRRITPGRLPAAQTVFAMTVHKAQGSEFDELVLILPPYPSRALSRELLYTGITRARKRVTLITPTARLAEAIASPVRRTSGLFDALWAS